MAPTSVIAVITTDFDIEYRELKSPLPKFVAMYFDSVGNIVSSDMYFGYRAYVDATDLDGFEEFEKYFYTLKDVNQNTKALHALLTFFDHVSQVVDELARAGSIVKGRVLVEASLLCGSSFSYHHVYQAISMARSNLSALKHVFAEWWDTYGVEIDWEQQNDSSQDSDV